MRKLMYAAACVAALVACSKEQEPVQVNEQLNGKETVLATAKDFVIDEATKTVITQSGSDAPAFAWKEGDVIGIIPMNNETVQSNYKVSEIGADPKTAMFDGGVWALKEGKEYAAYYPFNEQIARSGDNLEFSFLGQTQSANNNLAHLGAYDYMYASSVISTSGVATFQFNHLVSLVRLQLTVPATDTYKSVRLESESALLASKASLKLSDGTMTGENFLKFLDLNLSDINVSEGSVLTVWVALLPTTNIKGKTLAVKLRGATVYATGSVSIADEFKAGSAYSYSCAPEIAEGPEYVDLGLSVKWAAWNLGATKPEEYGGYYQWAGTEDVTSTSIYLSYSNCPYHTGSSSSAGWTKYVPSDKSSYWSGTGNPDDKTVLDPDDDVAYVTLGGDWRMPTDAEWTELRNTSNCSWTWTNDYEGTGIAGYIVTSKKSGYTDKSIFLPAAGYRYGGGLDSAGSRGYYWSSSLSTDSPSGACGLYFSSGYVSSSGYNRYDGHSVRPVSE